MKSEDGKVLIEGFYDDIIPLNTTEKDALVAIPNNDADLERDLQFAKPEGSGKRLVELLQYPSLNIRGLRSAYVGDQTQNVVPEKAIAAVDVRLVKGEDPDTKFEQVLSHIRKQGFFISTADPTKEERPRPSRNSSRCERSLELPRLAHLHGIACLASLDKSRTGRHRRPKRDRAFTGRERPYVHF
jgi:acetylornithine deacetylase/succinyl-diaminopimelate desuccinylase-like protein